MRLWSLTASSSRSSSADVRDVEAGSNGPGMGMPPDLTTHRLTLRPVVASDAEPIAALLRSFDDGREVGDALHPTDTQVRGWIAESNDPSSLTEVWTIATPETPRVGLIGLRAPSERTLRLRAIGWRSLELVVVLHPSHWGKGLAAEAIGAVATHAAANPVTFALVACVAAANERCRRVMCRCGFHELGRLMESSRPIVVYERPL